ncbi:MAG: hypothetical protein ACSHX6_06560 [Akkermansiaceae bacterium]
MTFLSELNINELGTSGTITAVIVVLTLLGFIKGAVKLVFLLFSLAGAGYAAYWGADEGLIHLQKTWPAAPEALGNVFAVICGLIAFYFLSKIFGFFTDPFENSNFIARFAFGIPAALVSLVAASGLVWLSLNFLKDKGAESEIKYWITQDDADINTRLKSYPSLASLKHQFESSTMGKKIADLYKLHESEKHNLAKLLVIANTSAEKINQLAQDERVKKILRNPQVRRLMSDPNIRKQIAENNVHGLLENPQLNAALGEQQLMEDLIAISSEQLK